MRGSKLVVGVMVMLIRAPVITCKSVKNKVNLTLVVACSMMTAVCLGIWSAIMLLMLVMSMMMWSSISGCFTTSGIPMLLSLFWFLIIILWIFHFSVLFFILVIFFIVCVTCLSLPSATWLVMSVTRSPWLEFGTVLELVIDPLVHDSFIANPYEVIVMAIDCEGANCQVLHSVVVSKDDQILNKSLRIHLMVRTGRAFVKFVIVAWDNCILHSWSHFYSIIVAIQLQVFKVASHFLLLVVGTNYRRVGVWCLRGTCVEGHILLEEASGVRYSTKVIKERKALSVHWFELIN